MTRYNCLKRKLSSEEYPLEKRLHLANNVYFYNYYSIPNKEENIISWFLELLTENTTEDKRMIWDVLKKCISSENFKNLGFFDLTDTFKSEMVQHIINHLNTTSQEDNLIPIECSLILLQQQNFYAYFKNSMKQYFELLFTTLNSCLYIEKTLSDNFILKLFKTMNDFWEQLSIKIEFIDIFINEGILPFVSFFENYHLRNDEESSKNLQLEVIKCLKLLVFTENFNRNICLYLNSIFSDHAQPSPSDDYLAEMLFYFLSNEINNNDKKSSYFLFTLIFRAFYSENKTREKELFQFLVTLCTIIGFKPSVKINEEQSYLLKPKKLKKHSLKYKLKCYSKPTDISFNILSEFLEILKTSNISFEIELNKISLLDWMQSLLADISTSTVGSDSSQLTISIIDVLSKFVELNPLIVLPNVATILPVLIKNAHRNKELQIPFEQCMHLLFKMNLKLVRMPKFFSLILETIHDIDLPKEADFQPHDILSEGLFKDIENYIPPLQPTIHLILLLKTFIYHLRTYYLNVLISTTNLDDMNVLYIETMSQLFCHYMRNLRIAEHTMTQNHIQQFKNLLVEVKIILNNIGDDLIQKEHNSRLMFTYLEMTYNYIELCSISIIYSNDCHSDSTDSSHDLLGLFQNSALHKHWHLISERVTNFGLEKCKEILNKLAFQKVRISLDLEKNPSCYLESITEGEISASLVLSNTQTLAFALESARLLKLTSHIIHQVSKGQGEKEGWNALVQVPHVQEVRPFVYALLSSCILRLKKLFYTKIRSPEKGKKQTNLLQQIAYQVLNNIDPELLMKTDCQSLDLKLIISLMIDEMNRDWQNELKKEFIVNKEELENILKFMKQLPIAYVPTDFQIIIILSVLIINWNLNFLEQSIPQELGGILLDIFYSPRAQNLSSSIPILTLIKWCRQMNLNLNMKESKLLYQRLYELFFKSDDNCNDETAFPFISNHHLETIKEEKDCGEIGLFLSTLAKNFKHLKGKQLNFYTQKANCLAEKIIELSTVSSTTSLSESNYSLQAYIYLLKKNIANSSESQEIMDKFILKHNGFYLTLTLEQLSCENEEPDLYYSYIQLLLGNLPKLQSFLPNSFFQDLWTLMGNKLNIDRGKDLRKLILHFAPDIDFTIIINNLIEITNLTSKNPSHLEVNLMLWHSMISSNLNLKKNKKRLESFYNLMNILFIMRQNWIKCDTDNCFCVLPILEIFEAILDNRQINLEFALLDSLFETLCSVPYSKLSPQLFPRAYHLSSQLLNTFVTLYKPLAMDRLHCLMQILNTLQNVLVEEANKDRFEPQLLMSCALSLVKVSQTICKNRKEVHRMAPYFISNIVHHFEKTSISPTIKIHIVNAIYCYLDVCDVHGLTFLKNNFGPASREIFNSIYEDYKKFYKFNAKV